MPSHSVTYLTACWPLLLVRVPAPSNAFGCAGSLPALLHALHDGCLPSARAALVRKASVGFGSWHVAQSLYPGMSPPKAAAAPPFARAGLSPATGTGRPAADPCSDDLLGDCGLLKPCSSPRLQVSIATIWSCCSTAVVSSTCVNDGAPEHVHIALVPMYRLIAMPQLTR